MARSAPPPSAHRARRRRGVRAGRHRCRWSAASGSSSACATACPTSTRSAASARWTRRRRSSTTTIDWPSRSSRSSGSTCRSTEISPHLVHGASSRSRISGSTITTASTSSASRRRRSPTSATAALAQGGSTITQQLARQSFLTPDKTLRRKLQELILAARIERLYSKAADPRAVPEQGVFRRRPVRRRGGVARLLRQARSRADACRGGAARRAGEVAVELRADRQPASARVARRNVVLQAMLDNGAIDRADVAGGARDAGRRCTTTLRADEPHGQYFKEQVRRELVDRFGWQRVYQGGLRVYSTIDMPMQQAAEAAVADGSLKALDARRQALAARARRSRQPPAADADAAAGGAGRDGPEHRRRARDGRRPRLRREPLQPRRAGAAAAGLGVQAVRLRRGARGGLHAGHDASITSNDPIDTLQGAWTPEDEHSTGDVDEPAHRRCGRRATAPPCGCCRRSASRRPCSTRRRMGVGDVPSVPSLALGSGEVTLQSMTAAYAAFANHGLRAAADADPPRRGSRRARAVSSRRTSSTRAISETTAFLMSTMLADVINAGTGARARAASASRCRPPARPARPTTSTTPGSSASRRSWSTGVWVGFDQPQTILPNGFAADVAVPLWARFMKAATQRRQARVARRRRRASRPRSVCRLSGKLATDGCEDVEVVDDDGAARAPVDGLHRVLRARHRADGVLRSAPDARLLRRRSPRCSTAATSRRRRRASRTPALPPRPRRRRSRPAAAPASPTSPPAEPPKKKRGFWSTRLRRRASDDRQQTSRRRRRRTER